MSGKKSTVERGRTIVFQFSSWVCGLFIGLMGIVSLGGSVVGGLILLLAGVLLLPPVFALIRRRVPALKGWSNALIAGVMFVTGVGFLSASAPEPEVRGARDQLSVEEEESADTAIRDQLQAAEEALEIETKAKEEVERVAAEEQARAEAEALRKRQAEEAEQARLAEEQRVREEEVRIAKEQEAAARAEEERAAREAEAARQAEAQRQAETEQARREEAARARSVAPTPQPLPEAPAPSCDPSYPSLCLTPGIGNAFNCPDVNQKDFPVLQPDPHGFDRDKDGIGCES